MQYQKQQIAQQQKLKMNPQLYQSIKLMALPVQDLRNRIQEELEVNPALEILEEKTDASIDTEANEQLEGMEYFENTSDPGYTTGRIDEEASNSKQQFLEGALSRADNLHDHLLWQLRFQYVSPEEFEIGRLLIHNLDDNGFHIENPETLVGADQAEALSKMIEIIRAFDPAGVCTADYRESLLVQAKLSKNAPETAFIILEDHFNLLEKGKFETITKALDISEKQLDEAVGFIKTLHPMPGIKYSNEKSRYVIPDVVVRLKDGELVIILNDEEIPVLGIKFFFQWPAEK